MKELKEAPVLFLFFQVIIAQTATDTTHIYEFLLSSVDTTQIGLLVLQKKLGTTQFCSCSSTEPQPSSSSRRVAPNHEQKGKRRRNEIIERPQESDAWPKTNPPPSRKRRFGEKRRAGIGTENLCAQRARSAYKN